jgi:protein TonB
MKAISLVLNAALAVSFFTILAFSQDKPQQDAPSPQTEKKITRIKQGGNITAKMLLKDESVQPIYPQEAKDKRIQGTVRLHVIIAKDGSVGQVELISGHPLLAVAALEAVRQWKYRRTLLNGEPVEVDTTVDVIFALSR